MALINYNGIIQLFSNIADAHRQLNSFGSGEESDGVSSGGDAPLYPRLFVVPVKSVVLSNSVQHTFKVEVMDLVARDLSNREEVLSDTSLILQDVIKIFRNEFPELITLTGSSTLLPFMEKLQDNVYGWAADLILECAFDQNVCDVPVDAFGAPSYGGSGGAVAGAGASGISGFSGFSGINGFNGTPGTAGASGYSGYSGERGAAGSAGTSGYSGYSGGSGTSGYSGYSGRSGYSGYSGGGYAGTSSTSLILGPGVLTLTTQPGLSYNVGSYVSLTRISNTNFHFQGPVTAYNPSTGVMTFVPDTYWNYGTGPFTDWSLSLVGYTGAPGTNGTNGIDGITLFSSMREDGTSSGTTDETLLFNLLIPAGTISNNYSLVIESSWNYNTISSNSAIFRVYFSQDSEPTNGVMYTEVHGTDVDGDWGAFIRTHISFQQDAQYQEGGITSGTYGLGNTLPESNIDVVNYDSHILITSQLADGSLTATLKNVDVKINTAP
jgi:hypothetical protein